LCQPTQPNNPEDGAPDRFAKSAARKEIRGEAALQKLVSYAAFRHQVKTLATPFGRVTNGPVSDHAPPKDFETALAELDRIVASMEGEQLPLAESLAAYKRGAELVAYCQSALRDAQQQIEILERGVRKTFSPSGGDDAP